MPQLGETVVEGTITKWLKNEGDIVERDEPLFEISTDKVDTEVPSPLAGTVVKISVPEGETVSVGTEVAQIDTNGSAADTAEDRALDQQEAPQAEPEAEASKAPADAEGTSQAPQDVAEAPAPVET